MNATTFQLNGQAVDLSGDDPTQSLLRWLRARHLTGTKEGCGDGDCGACTVVLRETDEAGDTRAVAVNSCLLPIGLLPGRDVLTVEALAQGEALHPVQEALVEHAASQCGYCTPGIVMSLYAGHCGGELSDLTTEGNLCRCTGYRPIRAATLALRAQAPQPVPLPVAAAPADAARLGDFHSPATLDQALALKAAQPDAAFIAGATDLGVNLSRGQAVAPTLIALDRIAELRGIEIDGASVTIGAGVPLTRLERELAGLFPALDDLLHWFAARQVRNRATLGGNLGSASPIGDLAPVLLALDADLELAGPEGRRRVALAEFFLDYRKTQRRSDEIIVSALLPRRADLAQAGYKIAKRQTDDISIVAAAFALARDDDGVVTHARLAFGGVAATPARARGVEAALLGKPLDAAAVEACRSALRQAFTPLSDHRASADYRRALCGNLFARFAREKLGVEGVA